MKPEVITLSLDGTSFEISERLARRVLAEVFEDQPYAEFPPITGLCEVAWCGYAP